MDATDSIRHRATYFNRDAFETDFSAFGYTGTGKAVTTVYGPAYQNLDISFTKNTRITERVNFRFECQLLQRVQQPLPPGQPGRKLRRPVGGIRDRRQHADFRPIRNWTHSSRRRAQSSSQGGSSSKTAFVDFEITAPSGRIFGQVALFSSTVIQPDLA